MNTDNWFGIVLTTLIVTLGLTFCHYTNKHTIKTINAMQLGYEQVQNIGGPGHHWVPTSDLTLNINQVCE